MIQAKLKLNKRTFAILVVVTLFGLIGYFFPHKPIIKETPALYKVIEVIDGDTIKVKMNNQIETVRLLGINTPEVLSPYTSEECYGKEASQKTKEILTNKKVYLIPDPYSSDRGKYGRLLRYIFLSNGEFVNAELIKKGYAFNYIYEPFQFMKYFDLLEKEAKENRIGLWSKKCNYYFKINK